MGIINEIKHVYESLNKLNRYELNSIIAERIATYSYTVLNEDELSAIKKEFGSVESFSNILAESFTRNSGSFDKFILNESLWGGALKLLKGGKRIFSKGGKGIFRRMAGKPVGKVVERFGARELDDIAKFAGKSVRDVSHVDIGKYITRGMTKNASKNVAKQLEKQASWLSKNTNMSAKQMEEFMQKYSKCPADCDPKIWKQAFEKEAKLFNNGVALENGLVRTRYNAIAKGLGKNGGALVKSAGKTTITRRMLDGVKKFTKGVWRFIKWSGIICLVIGGTLYFWDDIRGWVEKTFGIKLPGGSGGERISTRMDDIYPKIYGKDYLRENPEDYRII